MIAKSGFTDLAETFKLIEAHGVSVGHDEAVERDGEALLAEGVVAFDLAEHPRTLRDQKMLIVVGIDVGGDESVHGPVKAAFQAIGEDCFDDGSLKEPVGFSVGVLKG